MSTRPTFSRPPRLSSDPLPDEIKIDAPPSLPTPRSGLVLSLISGLLPMAVLVGIGLTRGGGTMLAYAVPMMAAGVLVGLITHVVQKRQDEEKGRKRDHDYALLLQNCQKRIDELKAQQQEAGHRNDPAPDECLSIVHGLQRNLWARSPDDEDYLALRLGIGERRSVVTVKAPQTHNPLEEDPLIKQAQNLAKKSGSVPDMPVSLDVRRFGVTALVGPRDLTLPIARALVIQLATHHAPNEVKVAVIYDANEWSEWECMRWLPHVWDVRHQQRFLAAAPSDTHKLFAAIEDTLDQRRRLFEESKSGGKPSFAPDFVVILAAPHLVEDDPVVTRLLREGPELGVFPVYMVEGSKIVPRACRAYVKMTSNEARLTLTDSAEGIYFRPDKASPDLVRRFAQTMAPIRLKEAAAKEIPNIVSLLDLFPGVRRIEELQVEQRWRHSEHSGKSLTTPIGVQAGGKLRMLDLHELKDGPNGLVAGMVGVGKSELLQTLVASLAINYHPHRLAFVLVDFKGGGMATPFAGLPHTLGVITNLLDESLAVRALTSFRVESQRRQRMFDEAGVNHIDDYQELYYKGKVREPMPYLVIIVDEFAEMKSEAPEVAKDFVKLARLGRALGLRLILAMQKPAGIVDGQIEANTRFRLCLRVAQTEDSQAMLKRPDAAFLTGTGRAYLQVGPNEVFELFQCAYSGAEYDPLGLANGDPRAIVEVGVDGKPEPLYPPPKGAKEEKEPKQLDVVTKHLAEVSEKMGITRLASLWSEPLPKRLLLSEARKQTEQGWDGVQWRPGFSWLAPVIGRFDNPSEQLQEWERTLRIRFGETGGHLAIYGQPGSGKTTLVQTLITSLALEYSPEDVNIYVFDFGGRLLKMYERLPHVGGVVAPDEDERFQRLFRYLLAEMDERRERFGAAPAATLWEYRQRTGKSMPAIVVILDNYGNFKDLHQDDESLDKLGRIARDGGSLGVHLVLTAIEPNTVGIRLSSSMTLAVALNLVDKSDYSAIVGRTDLYPARTPGRGLVRTDKKALEFQAALPNYLDVEELGRRAGHDQTQAEQDESMQGMIDVKRNESLQRMMAAMAEKWPGAVAPPIPMLAEIIPLAELLKEVDVRAFTGSPASIPMPLGRYTDTLKPFAVSLSSGPNFLIAGEVQSGKSTLLYTWLLALTHSFSPEKLHVYLLDSHKKDLAVLRNLPHVRGYASEQTESEKIVEAIDRELQRREELSGVSSANGGEAELSLSLYPTIVLVIDDLFNPAYDGIAGSAKAALGPMLRKGRRFGLHVLASGAPSDLGYGSSEPVKTLKEAQVGFMIGSGNDQLLNLRLPHTERDRALPTGEAYWKPLRGSSRRIKLATPISVGWTMNAWVERVSNQWHRAEHAEIAVVAAESS